MWKTIWECKWAFLFLLSSVAFPIWIFWPVDWRLVIVSIVLVSITVTLFYYAFAHYLEHESKLDIEKATPWQVICAIPSCLGWLIDSFAKAKPKTEEELYQEEETKLTREKRLTQLQLEKARLEKEIKDLEPQPAGEKKSLEERLSQKLKNEALTTEYKVKTSLAKKQAGNRAKAEAIAKHEAKKEQIRSDPDLSDEQKREKIREIDRQIIDIKQSV